MKKLRLRDEKRPRRAAEVEKRRGQEVNFIKFDKIWENLRKFDKTWKKFE